MKSKISKEEADIIALNALTYLVQKSGKIGEFLAESGLGPKEIKKRVQDPIFLAAVLDFYLLRSELLSEFARASHLTPQEIVQARHLLPGVPEEIWHGID